MSRREFHHIKEHPIAGDVIELRLPGDAERMIRVLCFIEDYVGFKEYGPAGRQWVHIGRWRDLLGQATVATVIRPGDYNCPF